MARKSLGIVLFRNDLRLHDNPVLVHAMETCTSILPLFIWDPRFYSESKTTWHFKFPRCQGLRKRFLLESLQDLQQGLQKRGSDLIILQGDPFQVLKEDLLPKYKSKNTSDNYEDVKLFMSAEYTYEENILVNQVKKHLQSQLPLKLLHTTTMVPLHKLPCRIKDLPDVYSHFRTMIEKARDRDMEVVAKPVATPSAIHPLPSFVPVSKNIWENVMDTLPTQPAKSAFPFKGGETAALERMHYYFESGKVLTYKQTRNGLLGADYSTKFSPWLALGCLSARTIMDELRKYEQRRNGGNESTYWVWFELLWREYVKFVAMKYGNRLFFEGGIYGKETIWSNNMENFKKWTEGKTGIPFVDANMRELRETGFMSNRGRQNVASFLVKDLQIDWRMGAEWFESLLLDHDPSQNYGNWLYVAGLGNDPRENRYFNMIKQAKDYDPNGEFVNQWIPELEKAVQNKKLIHTPWQDPSSSYYPPIVMGKGWNLHSGRQNGHGNKTKGNKSEKSKGFRQKNKNVNHIQKTNGQLSIKQFFN